MRALRILCSWIAPTSGHFAARRPRRGLIWAALFVAAMVAMPWLGVVPVFVVWLGQLVDAALIRAVPPQTVGRQLLLALVTLCISVLIQVTVRATWVEAFKIPSGAMIPTLQVGDHILVEKRARTPARGDVTVFKYPREPDKDFIKRVVAVGGDTIEVRDNVLVLNGKPVPRKHVDIDCRYDDFMEDLGRWEERRCEAWDETLDGRTYRVIQDRSSVHSHAPVTVPEGHYYVLGDNRDNSHDSRFWGFVPPENIKGVARKIWFSMGRDVIRWDRFGLPVR
jgi:signal peptidase I